MTPQDYCRKKTMAAGTSFFWPLLFFPRAGRQAMFALYSYCREVDDLVDSGGDVKQAEEGLLRWRRDIAGLFAGEGTSTHPVIQSLALAHARFHFPEAPFHEILDGMAMDLARQRYRTMAELEVYCRRVAGAVGELILHILGVGGPAARGLAHHLGLAFQMTNILRDVAEDAAMGRIYLPQEWLSRFSVGEKDLLDSHSSPALVHLLQHLAAAVDDHYKEAFAIIARDGRRALLPVHLMAHIYRATLNDLSRRGFPIFSGRTRLSRWRKLLAAIRAWISFQARGDHDR